MLRRRVAFMAVCFLLVGWTGSATAEEGDDAPPTRTGFFSFTHSNQMRQNPALDPFASPLIPTDATQWSFYHAQYVTGPHRIDVYGGLTSYNDRYAYGEMMDNGLLSTTIAYRYMGIAGGSVRPVARFSAGGAQGWRAMGATGFGGYASGADIFASSEFGMEIVYRGIGLGVTEKYLWTQRLDAIGNEDITGPAALNPQPDFKNWNDWFTNFYLILE